MEKFSFLNATHTDYYANLYDTYLKNPDSIEPSLRIFFQGFDFANTNYGLNTDEVKVPEQVQKEFKVIDLINAYRIRGHLFTKTNPVRDRRSYLPTLAINNFGLTDDDLETSFNAGKIIGLQPTKLKEIIVHLEAIYCDSIGIEYMYIRKPDELKWWQDKLNQNDNHPKYSVDTKKYLLSKLNQAVTFEHFLQTKFVGQKRFSLEGGETLIPALAGLIRIGAEDYEIGDFVLAMAHRGRLNTLVNIFRKPVRELFNEFEGKDFEDYDFDGDVKYHLGTTYRKTLRNNKEVTLNLVPNPSHLETSGPVAQGIARSKIETKYNGDSSKVLPIIVHGDAAIAGQGVVYEVIQMSQLNAYQTGGTVHIVVNNQVGFTTNYLDARSSTYCTDVGKVTLSPVLHVNADDVESVTHAVQLALDFRMRFKRDVFIDLLGYRKYGHNEGDEPRFTQPKLYKAIANQPNPKDIYAKKLIDEGVIDAAFVKNITESFKALLENEYAKSKQDNLSVIHPFMDEKWRHFEYKGYDELFETVNTKVSKAHLTQIVNTLSKVPKGTKFLRKAERILEDRASMFFKSDKLDWSMGELLAYGSLMQEGYNIRMSGQDVERGTFSHRHAILRDEISEKRVNLLNTIEGIVAKSTIYNSLLSEYGVLGFEYGFALADPDTLTIWEAQFGDFSNGAQIMFDQYISAAEDKWKQQNGIVVLLPHGYEGQGAEHSSARIERYLQLCAVDNMTVANCTTPANLFHLLRRQMKRNFRKPLIVFTPKSLLRHPLAVSSVSDFTDGSFQELIDDTINPNNVTKLVFCSGKLFYELVTERQNLNRSDIAFIRVEQLFPLHRAKIKQIISKYTQVNEYVWAQEEPLNMGAWSYMLQHFKEVKLEVVAQKLSAAPAAGSSARFKKRHQEVINRVFNKIN
ncbi:MAG: 2-oxoglutarate dehydrogenase E1 component [Flavobacteriales bacterium CG_4_9_14_0_2_um_filter_35_242]|nr:2-oxoglutarate dehydrogenase E1 component [Zetaproteobacteria bacterium]NDK17796.1 2-oxoglutarate dehydrogenase E1 component [Flavobacteriales bacterium]OIO10266.1 MAG: 2-oxoglutarate dehydrogenase E1 component [Flavobacteriaceae bacterium CG1_02_35_72]PJA05507.1 MAG: 2-oxoglutarate dehydrogenase E1 component [Flavobacteriales bacterium CG_4_10_14_0_2_um_filter_35_18]PJC58187.1 MAG: 2-oxoglutarate dehydrogenase E1 component [Flavobacteriales bacterium CG_4_9_14_0_2_um_filter_35_242]